MSELSRNELKKYFETGDIPTEQEFGDTIDSLISKTDDGITSIPLTSVPGAKAIGINLLKPASPLSVQAMQSGDAIAIRASSGSLKFDPVADADLERTIWHQMVNPFVPASNITLSTTEAASVASSSTIGSASSIKTKPTSATLSSSGTTATTKQAFDPLVPVKGASVLGYAIARETKAGLNALMILDDNGQMGIGKLIPKAKLHLSAITENDSMGIILENAATAGFWKIGHLSDNTQDERDSALKVCNNESGTYNERLIMLRNGNVGIGGATVPDTTLHIHTNTAGTNARVDLRPNTGSVVVGPLADNLTLDFEGLQARTAALVGNTSVLQVSTKELNIQPVGGAVVFHKRVPVTTPPTPSTVVKIDEAGNLGVGTLTPAARLHVNGAIKLDDANVPAVPSDGMIRWDGTNVLLYKQGAWGALSGGAGSNQWQNVATTAQIYYAPSATTATGVGIGTSTPTSMLHISDSKTVIGASSTAVRIENKVVGSGSTIDRIGLEISNINTWSTASSTDPHDVGLFVSAVNGMPTAKQFTAAAILNGNVIVGLDTLNGALTGTSGNNVLVLKEGATPSTKIGTTNNGGVQISAANRVTSASGVTPVTSVSSFQVMNGDGTVMRLYRQAAMTANVVPATIPVTATDANMRAYIENLRARLIELESILKNLGILPPTNPQYEQSADTSIRALD